MPYAGLPEGAEILPEGLPEGAQLLDSDGNPIIDVVANGEDMSVAEKLNNPFFGIDTPEKLRAEMKKSNSGGAQSVMGIATPRQRDEATRLKEDANNTLIGIGAGMYDAYKGVQQAGAEGGAALGMVKPETVAKITREGQSARDDFAPLKKQSTAANVGEFAGKLAPFLAIPAGAPTGALARFAVGAGTGGLMGATEFVPEGGSRALNTAVGAGMGGAGSLALSGAGKLYNAVKENPLARFAVNNLSERFKIPTTLSELTGGSNRTDTIMERVPSIFGIGGFRKEQQAAAKAAATEHFGKYVIDPTLDSTAAMKVANDAHLDDLYQVVRQHANSIPQATAPEVKAAATELLDRYPAVFETIQDSKVKRILQDIVDDTATKSKTIDVMDEFGKPVTTPGIGGGHGGAKPVPVSLLDASGKVIRQKVEPKFSFDDLWSLRKGIGQAMGGAKTPTESAQLGRIYSAVSDDMDTMLANQGDDSLKAFKDANDAFKQYSLKFDAMRQAYDKAIHNVGAGTQGFFSPQKYGTALKNLANDPAYKKNIKWSPQEVEEMTGLANILQVTKRAGQFMENPPTGNRWGMPSLATAAGGGAYYAGGVAATIKTAGAAATASLVTKFLTTTRAGKQLALSASRIEPIDPMMGAIVRQIYNQLPKFAAEAGIDLTQPEPEPLPDPLGIRK